ncbi:hypothetical protein [Mycobacterium servetii]|uniref:Uncharacterized protein n=1 Tax=Mycobacterium servetii TaxID=3237418 RepID=A0ABV4C542_9MYCO
MDRPPRQHPTLRTHLRRLTHRLRLALPISLLPAVVRLNCQLRVLVGQGRQATACRLVSTKENRRTA